MTEASEIGSRPPLDGGGQSVIDSVVVGDVIQVQGVGGDVTISAEHPPFRITDFPIGLMRLPIANARAQPSRLLLAKHGVVPFIGREQELRDLLEWLNAPQPVALRLVHGAGGQGKSRLAARLAADTAATGWLVRRAVYGNDLANSRLALPAGTRGLLVVVDYADRWPASHLITLVEHLHALAGRVGVPVRVLLLARSAGFWWPAVVDRVDTELEVEAGEQELEPLGIEVDRTALFVAARDAFAAAMDLGPVDHIDAPDGLGNDDFAQILAVHMAALAAVDAHRHGDNAPTEPQAISAYLLRRERAHWHQLHARSEDKLPTAPQTMGRAAYVAILAGTLPRHAAHAALTRAGVVSTMEAANQVLDDHRTCYPPGRGDIVLEPLHPDRLGEDFLALITPGHARDADACDDWAATAASRLLTGVQGEGVLVLHQYTAQSVAVLIEVARRWPHIAQGQLYPLLREQPWLVLAAGSAAMARFASLDDVDIGALEAIEGLFPDQPHAGLDVGIAAVTQRLTDYRLATTTDPAQRGRLYATLGRRLANAGRWEQALTACNEAVDVFHRLAPANPAAFEPELAWVLSAIGVVLSELGRWEEALDASTEAAEAYHRLAAEGTADLPGLAMALGNLSGRLSELGRWEEAVAAAAEAVEIHRRLATGDGGFELDLAVSLVGLGARLWDVGRTAEGLAATNDAIDILRRHAQANPTVIEHQLAVALNNTGAGLLRLGRRDEALAIMSEAVDLRRQLADANPARFEPDLGGSLTNFGGLLSELGRWEEAIAATSEAVEVYRRLAAVYVTRFESELGRSLINLGGVLVQLGRWEEAIAATSEAVEIYRRLAGVYVTRFEWELAAALVNLGSQLSELGRREDALVTTTEAVEICHRLARTNRAAIEPNLALALSNLGNQLSEVGRRDEALSATTKAVDICRRLAQANPAAFEADLARALANLSADLSAGGLREEALATSVEAVEVSRRLEQANLSNLPRLASALNNLGTALGRLGTLHEALTATVESVSVYRCLAHANPAAFEPDLARVLSNVGMFHISLGQQEKALASTREAVEIYRRFALLNPTAFRPKLARALEAAAAVRIMGKVELPQALDAAKHSAAIYEDLDARDPAAFTDNLIAAQHTVADVLDSLGEREEAAQVRRTANVTGTPERLDGLVAVTRVLVHADIQEALGETGMAQVMASLYPADCQTCGRPLGSAPPVLHVDDFDSWASVALHHSGCKSSEWNRAASSLIIIRYTSEPVTTWTCMILTIPATGSDGGAGIFPMLLVNPGLESVFLERDSSRRWRVQLESRFRDAGLVSPDELRQVAVDAATAHIRNGKIVVTMTSRSETYEASVPDQMTMNRIRQLGGLIFAVTHAINPAAVTSMRDLESVFAGDRSLMGWVEIEGWRS